MVDPDPLQTISLREITAGTVRRITDLQVSPQQFRFVASNAVSFAEALFHSEAWYRAIYRQDEPVGFVMLYDESLRREPSKSPQLFLWRFMVVEHAQHQGIGAAALELIVSHARSKGFREIKTSCVPGPGTPQSFYERHGFVATGEVEEGENVLVRAFSSI